MKRSLKIFIGIILLILPLIFVFSVKADAGWDSDYDSGGGWSSSSSWDSGSSWSSSGSSGDADGISAIVVIIVIIIFIVIACAKPADLNATSPYTSTYKDITDDEIQKILPEHTIGSLKHMALDIFLKVQNAWMDFDYDTLKEVCTDELYNSYMSDLEVLKLKNGQNIMSDFERKNIRVISIRNEGNFVTVRVYLSINFYDYVINQKTGAVTRGNKSSKIHNEYILEYVRDINGENQNIVCPNCGAEIKGNVSDTCEFCRSKIVKKPKEFVLSKKGKIR